MKHPIQLCAAIGLMAAAMGCNQSPNNSMAPSTVSALGTRASSGDEVLWRNGILGSWAGAPVAMASCCASTASVEDTLNGDPYTLKVLGTAPFGSSAGLRLSGASAEDYSRYYHTGHIQFDIAAGQALAATVSFGYYNSVGDSSSYSLPYASLAFSHVSIPLSAFSPNFSSDVEIPFSFIFSNGNPQSCYYLNDIRWTPN
jgi:hypothetical protein